MDSIIMLDTGWYWVRNVGSTRDPRPARFRRLPSGAMMASIHGHRTRREWAELHKNGWRVIAPVELPRVDREQVHALREACAADKAEATKPVGLS